MKLDIPAGEKKFLVTDDFTLPVDVDLLAIYPHAHYLGKDIQAFATLPDGTKETLIHILQWNLNWQAVYRYAEPVLLPKGTTVSMRYTYDNSDQNPMNPNHPPVRVMGGNRSTDEMCHLWLQVLPVNFDPAQGDPRMALQEALARHNVEKNPARFRSSLQSGCDAAGKEPTGRRHLQNMRLRCDCGLKMRLANNAFGSCARGCRPSSPGGWRYLQTALKARPDYFEAHYNLGIRAGGESEFGQSCRSSLALHLSCGQTMPRSKQTSARHWPRLGKYR